MPHKQCICQICNCGRHRCPHRSGRTSLVDDNTPCFITEYGSKYAGDTADRTESFQPKNRAFRLPETKMERLSTTAQDFPSHAVQKTGDFRPQREFTEPTQPMDLGTTYQAFHDGKPGEREKSYRPGHRVIGGGQFRTEQTSQDYKEWPLNKRQPILPHSDMEHPSLKFDNKSETQTRYIKPDGKAADSAKPPQKVIMSTDPFADKTSHQLEYTPKTIPDRFQRGKVVFQPPTVPHNMSSTYYDNYKGNPADRAETFKPKNLPYRYGDDKVGPTTHKIDYIPHPIPDINRHQPHQYEPVDTPMDLNTTHNTTFTGKAIMYGDTENYENVGDSQSHNDYAAPPIKISPLLRLKRRFSDQLIFGQDSPTYQSVQQAAFTAVQPPFDPASKARKLATGVDQRIDQVILGTASPRMLTTNHADYLSYPAAAKTAATRKSINYLNDSGFVFGEDDLTGNEQNIPVREIPQKAAGITTEHGDLFRSSAGLLMGQSSARFVSQTRDDFAGNSEAARRNRKMAEKNKEMWLNSSRIFAEGAGTTGGGNSTTNGVYGAEKGEGPVERVKRNLFRSTEGFSLGYGDGREEEERDLDRLRRLKGKNDGDVGGGVVNGRYREDDEWEVFSDDNERRRGRRRSKRVNRRNRHRSGVSSGVTSQRQYDFSVDNSNRPSLSQLEDQVRDISHARLDSNGLLWFPVGEKDNLRKGLPKWAATALNEEKAQRDQTTKTQPALNSQTNPPPAAALSTTQQPGNYAKQNDQLLQSVSRDHTPIPARGLHAGNVPAQKSIPSSTSDEGLVLDDSLHEPPSQAGAILNPSKPTEKSMENQQENRLSTGVSVYSRDSMESGRDRSPGDSGEFNSMDSLDRARSVSQLDGQAEKREFFLVGDERKRLPAGGETLLRIERSLVEEKSNKGDGSLLERTRDKMMIPKLIPAHREVEGLETQIDGKIQGQRDEEKHAKNEHMVQVNAGEKIVQKTEPIQSTIELENIQPKPQENPLIPTPSAEPIIKAQTDKIIITQTEQKQHQSPAQAAGIPLQANSSLPNQPNPSQQSLASPHTPQRKGRRIMTNSNSTRNQYPRATSLAGLMKQGYLEQTTTSQHAYSVPLKSTSKKEHPPPPTPKPRFQKKIPISETGEYILTTSRPLQHSPRNPSAGLRSSPIPSGSPKTSATSKSPKTSVNPENNVENEGIPRETPKNRRKKSSSHRMPANWERTLPIRYEDTLRFEGDQLGNLKTQTQTDFRGAQLADRPQSLDRKLLRSQMGNFFGNSGEEPSPAVRRRNRSQEPQDFSGMFAERRVPFSFKDHDIFEGHGDEKFDSQTENHEAFQKYSDQAKSTAVRPKNQLHLFSAVRSGDGRLRSVTQEVYQGLHGPDNRSKPFRPEALLNIFDGPESGEKKSTSQAAYQKIAPQPRVGPVMPRGQLNSGMGNSERTSGGSSGRRSRRRVDRSGTSGRDLHTAGLPTRLDKLPPVRGAISSSARSLDGERVPFSGTTTNHSDFGDPGSVARPEMVRQYSSGALVPASNARQSQKTTSHTAFKKYSNPEHALPILPVLNDLFQTDAKLSDRTTSNQAYKKYEFQASTPPTRNQSLPPRFSSRSLTSDGDAKERSRFLARTTNMDTYQNQEMTNGVQAAGVRTVADSRKGRVFRNAISGTEGDSSRLAVSMCPAALIISGLAKWEFAGKDHGHDYYNIDSGI